MNKELASLPPIPLLDTADLNEMINRALAIATAAHAGQVRRYTGEPYISHPVAVAAKVVEALKPIALLHDVLEDTSLDEEDLREQFPAWVVDRVVLLSRPKDMSYADFILRAGPDRAVRQVKRADIEHNASTQKPGSLLDKYLLAIIVLDVFNSTDLMRETFLIHQARLGLR